MAPKTLEDLDRAFSPPGAPIPHAARSPKGQPEASLSSRDSRLEAAQHGALYIRQSKSLRAQSAGHRAPSSRPSHPDASTGSASLWCIYRAGPPLTVWFTGRGFLEPKHNETRAFVVYKTQKEAEKILRHLNSYRGHDTLASIIRRSDLRKLIKTSTGEPS